MPRPSRRSSARNFRWARREAGRMVSREPALVGDRTRGGRPRARSNVSTRLIGPPCPGSSPGTPTVGHLLDRSSPSACRPRGRRASRCGSAPGASPAWAVLQRRGELEAVRRAPRGRRCRPSSPASAGSCVPGFRLWYGRVRAERLELRRVVGRAVVVHPGPAGGELLEPQHVHHARPPAGTRRTGPAAGSCTRRPAGRRCCRPGWPASSGCVYLLRDQPLGRRR